MNDKLKKATEEFSDAVGFQSAWTKNVKLIIDASGSLKETKSVILMGNPEDMYHLDIHHQSDNYYQLHYKGEMIGGLKQSNARITGEIDLSSINDDIYKCIVSHSSRVPSTMFLMRIHPKMKFDPRRPDFVTIEQFSD